MKEFVIRKRKEKNYVQVTCRIEEEILDKIDRIVLDCNLYSRNSFINDCLRSAVDNMKIEQEF